VASRLGAGGILSARRQVGRFYQRGIFIGTKVGGHDRLVMRRANNAKSKIRARVEHVFAG
jgi:hypothetical protein